MAHLRIGRDRFAASTSLLLFACLLALPVIADAGMENSRFAMHFKPKFTATKTITTLCPTPSGAGVPNYSPNWNSTTTLANPLRCSNYTVTTAYPYGEIYVVIGRAGAEGVSGVSFGIQYNGAPFGVNWTTCATGIGFPNAGPNGEFPASLGGTRITWNTATGCAIQQIAPDGVHAVVGSMYMYAYEPTVVEITPNNNLLSGPELVVANCAGVEYDLLEIWPPDIIPYLMGAVGLGGAGGFTPCVTDPVSPVTWGRLKTLYPDSGP